MIPRLLKYTVLSAVMMNMVMTLQAQSERKFVRQGNNIYEQALADTTKVDTTAFGQAEIAYRKALDKRPDDAKWNFNLGNALYKQHNFDDSVEKFEEIAQNSADKNEKSRAYYNMGNSKLMQNKLDESIEAYKNALRNNPNDLESKYNLVYAMNLKKNQEEQQQNDQDKDKDQDKEQNKNQQDKEQDQDNPEKDQEDGQQDKNPDKQDQNDQQQQQEEQKISRENAERLLKALQDQEKKLQEKMKEAQAAKAKDRSIEKNW